MFAMALDDERDDMADADAVHQQSAQPSSDSDSDSDADESAQLEPLEAALVANPNNYHAHAQVRFFKHGLISLRDLHFLVLGNTVAMVQQAPALAIA